MQQDRIAPSETKYCEHCGNLFYKKRSTSKTNWIKTRFCSRLCCSKAKVGFLSGQVWNKGIKIDRSKYPNMGHFKKHTKEALEKITEVNRINASKKPKAFFQEMQKRAIEVGKKNHSYKGTLGLTKELSYIWKGNDASYSAKHKWIIKHWIKTGICQKCGIIPLPKGRIKNPTQWHNIDGNYNREDKNTWIEVCSKCHRKLNIWQTKHENTI